MEFKKLISGCFLLFVTIQLSAQSLYLDFLFNAGVTYSSEIHAPSRLNDSVDFRFQKHRLNFVLPLKTKIGVDLKNFDFKKMDAKASQLFLTAGVGLNQVAFNEVKEKSIYRGTIGLTGIKAGIRKGVWIYSANFYINENEYTFTHNMVPNFRGYLTKVKVKSLDFIYFYGGGLIVNLGRFYPVPIFGVHKKMAHRLKATFIFPMEIKINKKLSSKFDIDAGLNYDGINTIYRKGSVFQNNEQSVNYRQLKPFVATSAKFSDLKLKLELGWSTFQQYSDFHGNSQRLNNSPYIAVALNYQIGKSLFGEVLKPKD